MKLQMTDPVAYWRHMDSPAARPCADMTDMVCSSVERFRDRGKDKQKSAGILLCFGAAKKKGKTIQKIEVREITAKTSYTSGFSCGEIYTFQILEFF